MKEEQKEFTTDEKRVSYFKAPIQNTSPSRDLSMRDIYSLIRGDELEEQTQVLNYMYKKDKKLYSSMKESDLPYVTYSGKFKERSEKGIIKHSGYICIDIDGIQDLPQSSANFPSIVLLHDSPSGNGVKIVFEVDFHGCENIEAIKVLHKCYSRYLTDYYTMELILKGYRDFKVDYLPDMSRACFLCHDSSVCFEEEPEILSIPLEVLQKYAPKERSSTDITNKTMESVEWAVKYLEDNNIDLTSGEEGYNNWIRIGLSLSNLDESNNTEEGRRYFHRVSQISDNYNFESVDSKFTSLIGEATSIGVGSFIQMVNEVRQVA